VVKSNLNSLLSIQQVSDQINEKLDIKTIIYWSKIGCLHLRVFGTRIFAHIPKHQRSKMDPRQQDPHSLDGT
jgi:hypothetical protein